MPKKQATQFPMPDALRGLVEAVFPPDELGIDPTSGVMAAPLVSIFKDKGRREVATELTRKALHGLGEAFKEPADEFIKRYPRIAAHMRVKRELVDDLGGRGVTRIHSGKMKSRRPVKFDKGLLDMGPAEIANTLYHEGTHVAQALGNRKAHELYNVADELVGYRSNPFEVTAVQRGEAAAQGFHPKDLPRRTIREGDQYVPYTVTRGLQDIVNHPPVGVDYTHQRELDDALGFLKDTLKRRSGR